MNKYDEIVITDRHIEIMESKLLKNGSFDENRKDIIRNFKDSINVNACAGSGKTTVLLAKLELIINKLPFEDGSGICILTHTNVAIDEIKNRLGEKSEILFKYPNYIGTIQTFIQKYLTNPFFKSYYKKDIKVVDNNEYLVYLGRKLKDKGWTIPEYTWKDKNGKLVCGNNKLIYRELILEDQDIKVKFNFNIKNEDGLNALEMVEKDLLNEGYLTYKDAYDLANVYRQINKDISKLFNSRFKFVFIDEMQDTNEYQSNLLENIFNKECIVIQKFGDINQSILGGQNNDEKCGWNVDELNLVELNTSKRYGCNIAKVLNYIRYSVNEKIEGNKNIQDIKPYIISFNYNTKSLVIQKFIDIINENKEILNNKKNIFKVIGRVGQKPKNDGDLTIKSYNDNYFKKRSNEKFNCKTELLNNIENKSSKDFFEILFELILKSLYKFDKDYNRSKVIQLLESDFENEYLEFKKQILNFYLKLKNNESVNIEEVSNCVIKFIKDVFGQDIDVCDIEQYFIFKENEENKERLEEKSSNKIKLSFDTVNGVKGETHTATLYLQTKYKNYYGDLSDINQIIDFMDGTKDINNETDIDDSIQQALNIAYVAMSRPTHLLCLAIHQDTIKGREEKLKSVGYNIVYC